MKYRAMSSFAIRSLASCSAKKLLSVSALLFKSTGTCRLRFAMLLPLLSFFVLGAQAQTNVVTQHNDNSRTGQNNYETILTPSNVNSNTFGRLFSYQLDGQPYAQPLYVAGVTMGSGTVQAGTTHNVVFVATEHDSVYAFDADSNAGSNASPLWKITLLDSSHGAGWGATTVPSGDVGTDDINPEIGITATPVIDTTTNTLYVVGKTKENSNYFQRLHALDITTGAEKSGSPVTLSAQVNGNGNGSSGGVLRWDAKLENNRPGLLLLNGTVYIAFAAHGDQGPYHGWILAYNAATLQQTSVFCPTANGTASGIWMSGAGLAADNVNSGRLFVATGNGAFNAAPPYSNSMSYGDDLIRIETSSGAMRVSDQFTAFNQNFLSNNDLDLGSGGVLLLPDQFSGGPTHLMVQASKEGRIYLVDRDNLGGYNSSGDNIVQEVTGKIGGVWGSPAYWNGHLYFWASNDNLKSFSFLNGSIGNYTADPTENGGYPGPTPSISSNGNSNGIVWDVLTNAYTSGGPAVLMAHSAANVVNMLYSSSQNLSRDNPGAAVKFVVPTITNGKVYVGTSNFLSVYGLLGAAPQASAPVLNPGGENFTGSVSVAITDSTPGASIFYTTNGSTPTTSSAKYSGPINVTASETIKAIASASGYGPSAVASETYNLQSQSGGSSTINFGSGFGSAQNSMRFNGSAVLSNGVLQLTNGGSAEAGSAWFNTTVNITQFTNDFAFQLVNPNADGITFTIQNAGLAALGNTGGSLGYAGIAKSVAVKFDLYNNGGEGIDSTGLYQNSAVPITPASDLSSSGINLHSGDKFSVHMTYNGATLAMTITDGTTGAVYNTSWSINIPQVIGSNIAFVGFTGGTGGLTATQNIQTWTFVSGTQQATAPIFSPAPGSYATVQSVALSTPTPGASIHYTTDGSTPSVSSALYSQSIPVGATETIKALTVASGYSNSSVSAGTYTISSGGSGSGGGGGVGLGGGFTAGAMALNGSATLNGTRLRLTDGGGSEAAAAWYNSPVNIQQFTTNFSFQVASGTNPTADGFTFAIQGNNTAALGPPGGALGYANGPSEALSQKSVAIKFDLYDNAGEGVNSTGLFTNGATPTTPSVDLTGSGIDLHSGDVLNVKISYDGTNLSMTITDPTANATFTHAWPVNISSVVGASTAFAGFTAGTGGLTAVQDIINWTFTPGTSAPGGGGSSAVNFGSGFSATGMQFNGNAVLAGNRLQLSDTSTTFEDSSAFWNQKVNVQSFTNDFTFQIANPGADGITFAIQGAAPTALGVGGGSLGYGGMTNSVAVKFDIYDNAGERTNSTGLYLNGAVPTVPATTIGGGVNLQSGDVMAVHMTYDGTTLTMTIKDASNPTQTFTTSWPVNIPATVGSTAYVGFTGATGGLVSTAQILTWSYSIGTSLVVQTAALAAAAQTSGPAVQVFSYQNFPDGLGTMFYSTSVGDNVTFMVNVPAAGTYDVKISYKQYQPRGILQTAINNASVGPPVDQFIANADAYAVTDLGAVNFSSAGNYPFTFKVVGKNPASTGYSLAFDDITLTPQ
ncbi:MAG TPA: chitobiase/beta-hexosaminidase C-terminal domain-containing protein [Methylomirabilota bacterium]|nr:chitobiase/beta-hexosaminidase C-terminal domain-containing protein [Methylomirabilota bacterium]